MSLDKRSGLYKSLIHSARWREFRNTILDRDRGLCQSCLRRGFYRVATEVHHIHPVDWGRSAEEKTRRCFDPANVESLCHSCHRQAHRELCNGSRREHRQRRLQEKIDQLLKRRQS